MKQAKNLFALLLALLLVVSLAAPALAADVSGGSITLKGATIGESYHIYRLFDVKYGATVGGAKIPTAYVATKAQVDALKDATGNVFAFTKLSEESYQVDVGKDSSGNPYTDQEIIDFLKTFVLSLSDGVTRCSFPGAVEVTGTGNTGIDDNKAATASTVKWNGVPAGYYFVTSSLGSVVTIDTSNPNATISDKNSDDPDWNNEPDGPEENPKKDVQNGAGQSIDGEQVKSGDTLTYVISYTYKDDDDKADNNGNAKLESVVITDEAPKGTTYVANSAKIVQDVNSGEVKVENGKITWSFKNVEKGSTVVVEFKVTVNENAVTETDNKTIVNDANVNINNKYDIKTNEVKNPVDDPKNPKKEVLNDKDEDIDGKNVKVGDTLTYKVSYTYTAEVDPDNPDTPAAPVKVVIKDAPPAGTVYLKDTAKVNRTGTADPSDKIEIGPDGTITWTFLNVADREKVEASFDVRVTEAAREITDETIENEAKVKVNDDPEIDTNKVKNPVGDPDGPVKDVLNASKESIDGQNVKVGNTLTYKISYTNKAKNDDTDSELDSVVITDAPPTGTEFVADSAKGTRTKDGNTQNLDTTAISVGEDGTITWTFKDVAVGETVDVYFDVKVTNEALNITTRTIENDALVDVTIGDNTYNLKTNKVKNPVGDEPGDPNPGKVIVNPDGTQTTTSTGKFGDTVSFDVGINAVNKVKQTVTNKDGTTEEKIVQVQKYYIYDKLDKGFKLDESTMAVTINGVEYKTLSGHTIKDGNKDIGMLSSATQDDGTTVIVATIFWVDDDGEARYPNCKIHLTYQAAINTDAVIAGEGNKNRVYYDYSTEVDNEPHEPDPDTPTYPSGSELNHGSDEKVTTTYTYALGLQKVSKESGAPLAGAKFTVKDAGGNPVSAAGSDGVYAYGTGDGSTTTFVTNAQGQIIIKGVDIGTYTFTETAAPDGYNLLTEPVSVEAKMERVTNEYHKTSWSVTRYFEAITKEEFASFGGDVYTKKDGKFELTAKPAEWSADTTCYKLVDSTAASDSAEPEITNITFPVNVTMLVVENNAGSLLPSTGGMGTTLFYILGGILAVSAAVLLVVKKRMSAEK